MKKKRLVLRGFLLVVAATISGMLGFSLQSAGAEPFLYWVCVAGFCLFLCFGLAALIQAYQRYYREKETR